MKARLLGTLALLLMPLVSVASPFFVKAVEAGIEDGKPALTVSLHVPQHHHLFADEITLSVGDGTGLVPLRKPVPNRMQDLDTKETVNVYEEDVSLVYPFPAAVDSTIKVKIRFRGCSDSTCFLPDTTNIVVAVPSASRIRQPDKSTSKLF